LSKAEEILLFTELSQDEEARNYFKDMNTLRSITESAIEEYPDRLDDKVFTKISSVEEFTPFFQKRSNLFNAVSYVFAMILLIVSIFFYYESSKYKDTIELTYQHLNQQNRMINVLLNGLPPAEVRAEFANEVIITPKM
jgi:hypothetical protein